MSSIDSLSDNPLSLSGDSLARKPSGAKAQEGHFLLNPDGTIQYADIKAAAMLGREGECFAGQHLLKLLDFAIETAAPDGETIQWDLLVSSALETRILVPAKRGDTGSPLTVHLLFTESDGAYFASITDQPAKTKIAEEIPIGNPEADAETEHRWAALFEGSNFGLFDLNFGSEEIYYSPGWKQMLEFADDELPNTQSTWIDLIHPDDSDAAAPTNRFAENRTSPVPSIWNFACAARRVTISGCKAEASRNSTATEN